MTFQSVENYFKNKRWSFPITILNSTLATKYYSDTVSTSNLPEKYSSDVGRITSLYKNSQYLQTLLTKTIIDTSSSKKAGYAVSKPTILIDTIAYGSNTSPKIFLGFNVSIYKINSDSASLGIPCEDCVLEENRKILKYPHGIFFELNTAKDSLIFSRWE